MKNIEDIERMDIRALEEAAEKTEAVLSEDLAHDTEELIDAMAVAEELMRENAVIVRRRRFMASIAAGVVLVFGIGLGAMFGPEPEPVDTFDDPMLAYAEVQKTFGEISRKMKAGVEKANYGMEQLQKPAEIIKNIIN